MIPPLQLIDADVRWFGVSQRLIAGRPDTRYGWFDGAGGPCIVKAFDLDLALYAGTLHENERRVLRHLRGAGAPVPTLVDCARADWLVTRFAGLSHRSLRQHPGPGEPFSFEESVAAWVHFLRAAQRFDDAGALPLDLWGANLVLPLTGSTSGQLRLHEAVAIDHAHTIVAGFNLRRPVWLDGTMRRIAPELRAPLRADQQAMKRLLAAAGGVDTPLARRRWAEYDARQELQAVLDDGRLDRGAAMQYAIGVELEGLAQDAPSRVRVGLRAAVARMQAVSPVDRFRTLGLAAAGLQSAGLSALPMVGGHRFPQVDPADLMRRPKLSRPVVTGTFLPTLNLRAPAETVSIGTWAPVSAPAADAAPAPPGTGPVHRPRPRLVPWLHVMIALGAMAGAALSWAV